MNDLISKVALYAAGLFTGLAIGLVLVAVLPSQGEQISTTQPSTADLARWQHSVDARLMKHETRLMQLESSDQVLNAALQRTADSQQRR